MTASTPRILVVDDDAVTRRILLSYLRRAGFAVEVASDVDGALRALAAAPPSLVLLDLGLPPTDGYVVLAEIRRREATRDLPVLVLTARDGDDEVERTFGAGADDFLRKPFREVELLARIRAQLRLRGVVAELARKEQDASDLVELTRTLASSLDVRSVLGQVVRRTAASLRVDRCSIVSAREDDDAGWVLAASDEAAAGRRLELSKYPEIQAVLRSCTPLSIADIRTHPLLAGQRDAVANARCTRLTLVPLVDEGRAAGVFLLRSYDGRGALDPRELSFCQTVANAVAVALRNAGEFQRLREERQAFTYARFEAERRARLHERYADLFESAADGMVVTETSGLVLLANPRAAAITGYPLDEMRRAFAQRLVIPADRPLVRSLQRILRGGELPPPADVRILRRDGALRTLAISLARVVRGESAVLVTFRDVTEDRRVARELAHTKEFLASMIESTPDAIMAAGLDGTVLIFNSAAERILGYRRDEVVGSAQVASLYPPGVARDVMRRIRQTPEGRLENLRTEVLSRQGERIPILLSAGLVRENGTPIATVGVFSDLRERLRMEERLQAAQEQLLLNEKHVLIAELAGAAAHELNQPLTAVQGYAEMLQRRGSDPAFVRRSAEVILHEAERMAEMVRRIGKIARYETKDYAGKTKIVDLARAAEVTPVPPPPATGETP